LKRGFHHCLQKVKISNTSVVELIEKLGQTLIKCEESHGLGDLLNLAHVTRVKSSISKAYEFLSAVNDKKNGGDLQMAKQPIDSD